jgi:hypothetical protein
MPVYLYGSTEYYAKNEMLFRDWEMQPLSQCSRYIAVLHGHCCSGLQVLTPYINPEQIQEPQQNSDPAPLF